MRVGTVAIVLSIPILMPDISSAQPPPDQSIEFRIHEIAGDPQSAVIFVVRMSMFAADADGDYLGWEVTSLEFRKVDGEDDVVWRKDAPVIATTDGLWWVAHADPANPQVSEFRLPPWLYGTAAPDDPENDDLIYDFEGTEIAPPGGNSSTSAMSFQFTLSGASEPVVEGEEVPVESGEVTPEP